MIDWLVSIDTQLFLFLNGLHCALLDPIMIFFSGKTTWIPLYLLIIFFMYKKMGWRMVWALIALAVVVVLADQTSVKCFKNVVQRLRPCHTPAIKEMVYLAANRCGGKYGFVSSHAANTFGVAIFLAFLFTKKWFSIGIIVWAALVSYSRIYLGVHFPGDIVAGAALGAICGYVVWKSYQWLTTKYLAQKEVKENL